MKIYIKTLDGKTIQMDIKEDNTIRDIKNNIENTTGILSERQRLFFAGKELDFDRTVKYYNIKDESTIHLILNYIILSE